MENEAKQILLERNQIAAELIDCHSALEVFAQIYDKFLEQKGLAWCKHWECVPINQLKDVNVRIPLLSDCRRAKEALECENI